MKFFRNRLTLGSIPQFESGPAYSLLNDPSLIAYYKFNTGNLLVDSSGNGKTLTNVNSVSENTNGVFGGCADFGTSNTTKYLQAPNGLVQGVTGDFTISFRINWTDNGNWSRTFDFGTGTGNYMFITPKNSTTTKLRYAILKTGGTEQILDSSAVLPSGWHQVTITRLSGIHYLYVDGTQVGTSSSITYVPSDLGNTTQNYIGKSQFVDPYFCGLQDDWAMWGRGFTPTEVTSYYNEVHS